MGRRNEHTREQQREMAIAAAELLLVREGTGGLTMRRVAKAIGYTVGNLYLLFRNQDDLLAAVNERTADAIYAHLRDAMEPQGEADARLIAMARAYVDYAARNPHRFRLLFEHRLPLTMRPRPTAELRIRRMYELVESCLVPWLPEAAQAERRHLAATALWSGVHGVCMLAVSDKLHWSGGITAAQLSDALIHTFLTGMRHESS
jgi:AcrR family transcriptional regulator